jgi:hypothetical protein
MTDNFSVFPRNVLTPSLNLITNSSTAALLGAQTRSFFDVVVRVACLKSVGGRGGDIRFSVKL